MTAELVLIFDGENCRAIIASDSETQWRERERNLIKQIGVTPAARDFHSAEPL